MSERLWFHVDASLGGFGILDPGRTARFAGLQLAADPELNIVTFRHRDGNDELNAAIPIALQRAGEIFLIGTRVDGREAMRACFMHHGTTDADVDRIVPAVLRAADEVSVQLSRSARPHW